MPLQPLPDASGKIAEQGEQQRRLEGEHDAELRRLPADVALFGDDELRQEGKEEKTNFAPAASR